MYSYGKILASYRKKRKMTQQMLADEMTRRGYKTKAPAISAWEKEINTMNICQFFMAIDHGIFGDRAAIEDALSKYMDEIRSCALAEGAKQIYTPGEKELRSRQRVLDEGVSLNDKTYGEMKMIADYTGAADLLPAWS